MFIPYRAKIKITRIPVMTILVTVVCLLVYWNQEKSDARILAECRRLLYGPEWRWTSGGRSATTSNPACHAGKSSRTSTAMGTRHLAWHLRLSKKKVTSRPPDLLVRHVEAFAAQAPSDLTGRLVHHSGSWNPLRLLSSDGRARRSWDHVLGNLFFFVAFAMVVETVIGPVLFLLVFLAMGLGTGALENLVTATREGGSQPRALGGGHEHS